jgi:hypothetical protein
LKIPTQSLLSIPFTEKLKSIPEFFGLRVNEEPHYGVVKKEGDFEIRQYVPQVLASVTVPGDNFRAFRKTAFKTLAAYIFGENKKQKAENEPMAMTSPVLLEKKSKKSWTMSFVLPSHYTRGKAPAPKDGNVKLRDVKSYYAAVVTYSGNNTAAKIKAYEKILAAWIKTQPNLQTEGNYYSAQYDAPFVIPFLKKNEVQVKVNYLQ